MRSIMYYGFLFLGLVATQVSQARELGYEGRDGESGSSGRDGYDSRDEDITLDGRNQNLDLTARDGGDGYDGYDGRDATACGQDKVAENLYGARGGNGGSGGSGGNGGNIGRITLRYNDVAHLKNLTIRGTVGRGGFPGRSGRGGRGCSCTYRTWEIEKDGKKRTYTCTDGRDGYRGNDGSRGKSGGVVIPILIPTTQAVPSDNTRALYWAKDFPKTPVELVRNLWEQRNDLSSLLAPGSRFINTYYYLKKTVRKQFAFNWEAQTPITAYPRAVVQGDLVDESINPIVNLQAGNAFAATRVDINGDLTTLTVEKTISAADTQKLTLESVNGSGRDFAVFVKDASGLDKYIKTRAFVYVYQKIGNNRYVRYFQNYLNDSLLTKNDAGDTLIVNVGKETSIPETVFKTGNTIWVQVLLERYVAGNYVSRVDLTNESVIK